VVLLFVMSSQLVIEDWKLKARTVVKLHKNIDLFVSVVCFRLDHMGLAGLYYSTATAAVGRRPSVYI